MLFLSSRQTQYAYEPIHIPLSIQLGKHLLELFIIEVFVLRVFFRVRIQRAGNARPNRDAGNHLISQTREVQSLLDFSVQVLLQISSDGVVVSFMGNNELKLYVDYFPRFLVWLE